MGYLHVSLKLVAGLLALPLLYVAIFLYKDEREGVQNYLDQSWKALRKRQGIAISSHVAFMQTVADMTSGLFSRIFGERYFSLRAFAVSICLSMLSLLVSLVVQVLYESVAPEDFPEKMLVVGILVIVIVPFVICLVLSIRFPRLSQKKTWLFLVFCAALIVTVEILRDEADLTAWYVATLLVGSAGILIVSFTCDIAFMAITRQAVRWASGLNSFPKIVGIIILNLLMTSALLAYPLWWSSQQLAYDSGANKLATLTGAYDPVAGLGEIVNVLSCSNFVDALAASIFIIFGVLMLLHRVFWPLLARPVYALADLGVIGHRKLFGTVGLVLMGYATGKPMEIVTKLLDAFLKK